MRCANQELALEYGDRALFFHGKLQYVHYIEYKCGKRLDGLQCQKKMGRRNPEWIM